MNDPNMTAEEHAYWEGAASRQVEINELKVTIVKYEAGLRKNKANKHKLLAKNIELQARVDATEKWIELNRKTIALEYSGYTTEEYVDAGEVTGILKGGSSE